MMANENVIRNCPCVLLVFDVSPYSCAYARAYSIIASRLSTAVTASHYSIRAPAHTACFLPTNAAYSHQTYFARVSVFSRAHADDWSYLLLWNYTR